MPSGAYTIKHVNLPEQRTLQELHSGVGLPTNSTLGCKILPEISTLALWHLFVSYKK
jgi:hypothetical protein